MGAYKALVRKLNEDLVLYRQQLRNLELSNVQLTSKMGNFEDKKLALLKLAELNEMDKSKLNKSFRIYFLFRLEELEKKFFF